MRIVTKDELKIGDKIKWRFKPGAYSWDDGGWQPKVFTVVEKHPKRYCDGKCAVAYDGFGEYDGYITPWGSDNTVEYGLVEEAKEMIKEVDTYFFERDGWKVGDKVLCLYIPHNNFPYVTGHTYTLKESPEQGRLSVGFYTGFAAKFKKVEEMQYEDKWYLNDGSEPIPEDADTLEKDGSVVAYRKVKKPVVREYTDSCVWVTNYGEVVEADFNDTCTQISVRTTFVDGKLTDVKVEIL